MTSMKLALAAAAAVAPLALAGAAQAQTARNVPACAVGSFKAPANATITEVKAFAGATPYCRVDGYVTTTNPGPNKVRFMVALPQKWAGRYLFTVQGGAAGFIVDPTEAHLSQGYAVASTDKGVRTSHILDFSFRADPAQSLDWGHRGVHVAALATQALTRDYYKQPKIHRYVMGCSGGGDGSLTEAEKYPTDFDAFLPGAMTYNVFVGVFWGALAQHVNRNPDAWISPEEMKRVEAVVIKENDPTDGVVDGLIWDPTKVKLNRASLGFLSDAQFGTLQLVQNGLPKVGPISYPGFYMTSPASLGQSVLGSTRPPWGPNQGPGLFTVTRTAAQGDRGADYDVLKQFDYKSPAEMEKEYAFTVASGRTFFDAKNMAGVKASGAKVLMWTGAADQAVPPANAAMYAQDVARHFGPSSSSFYRAFFAPALLHCAGGEGAPTDFQDVLLEAAVNWVEKGKAPDHVIATNAPRAATGGNGVPTTGAATGKATRTYLICAYPKRSVFKGGMANTQKLDVNDANNWRCEA